MQFVMDRLKLVCEPSGAITVAALIEGLVKGSGTTVCILSGGNIEYDGLRAVLGERGAGA
jgi:threonine dehydratase